MITHALTQTLPFSLLPTEAQQRVASAVDVIYLPAGDVLRVDADQPDPAPALYTLFKGRGLWQMNSDEAYMVHAHESLGSQVLLQGGSGQLTAEEEVLLYRLPASVFHDLCQQHPAFLAHWNAGIADKLSRLQASSQTAALADIMMVQIEDAWLCPPLQLSASLSLPEAARQLREAHCTAALVALDDGQTGIVTGNDLLSAFAQHPLDALPRLGSVATAQPVSISAQDYLFNALLTMTEHNISHLPVMHQQQAVGILQQKTLLGLFANQSVLISQQIERAASLDDLMRIGHTQTELVRSLHSKGVKTRLIAELVSTLNRRTLARIAELTQPEHGLLGTTSLLVLGSEGRQEQILHTDQDNALIWDGEPDPALMAQWAQRLHDALQQLGYPDCPGNIMVTNPLWRQPLTSLLDTARRWIHDPSSEGMMYLSILLDADTAAGNPDLTQQLLSPLRHTLASNRPFLGHFARGILQFDTPLGIFSHFVTEKTGQRRTLDIKKGGVFPIVHGARVLACERELTAITTHQRLLALADGRLLEKSFASELGEALEFMQQLRLNSQLEALRHEREPDNLIEPELLNHLQRDLLKDSLKLVDAFKSLIHHHYKLQLIS